MTSSDLPSTPLERRLGSAFQTLALGSALTVIAISLLCVLLSLLGWWVPWLVWPLAIAVAAGSGWWARGIPSRSLPVGAAAGLAAIVVAFAVWAGVTHGEQALPRRDAGSNVQAAIALADNGSRQITIDPKEYGGANVLRLDGLTVASPAFYAVGEKASPAVQPQFVIGPAAIYSLGVWAGGPSVALLLPALSMALALLAMGLLIARTVGPRWAPLGAGTVALLFPMLHVSRAAYSEPLATLTLSAGLLALVIAARPGDADADVPWRHSAALLAGILVGGTVLVRIDGIRETVLLLVAVAMPMLQRLRWPRRLLRGAAAATGLGLLAALVQANQYLGSIAGSLVPLLALGVAFSALLWAVLAFDDRGLGLPQWMTARLPVLLPGLIVLLGLFLASRPLWQTVRQSAADPGARYVAGMQSRQGLPIDGGRTYAEQTVVWLSWWMGPIALAVALIALAVLARRIGLAWRDGSEWPAWAGPVLVATGSSVLTLWRPGITPDHPWAERRLVIVVPFVALLAVATTAWVVRQCRRRWPIAVASGAGVAVAGSLIVPSVLATWPHVGGGVERGELEAISQGCKAFRPGDVALMVDSRAANEWPQTLRGCGIPALVVNNAVRRDPTALTALVREISASMGQGHRPVLVAAESPETITGIGVIAQPAVSMQVQEEEHLLERRPESLVPLKIELWTGRP